MNGGDDQGGLRVFAPSQQRSAKNQLGQTHMKLRQEGQGTAAEREMRDMRAELEAKEHEHFLKTKSTTFEQEREEDLKLLSQHAGAGPPSRGSGRGRALGYKRDPGDEDGDSSPSRAAPRARAQDADVADSSASSSDESDSDEDEEAELMAELARIKAERAAEASRKEAEAGARAAREQEAEHQGGNPLLRGQLEGGEEPAFQVKRRWNDDVVFKNQSRSEPKTQKRFINDTIRSDFHRRFLEKYIR
ncbi:Cwf15/Cwc15 cell cycle control protein [Helicosporidium sp. ATCC 50920]|nr:Cwf15/Cwc15 cell cycle control protein [Helicosporidium sp. ATCC 50920]|eukprot:KDD75085.1 Cwf15/Cwc15 cell cycle control protein [Helicosporidium sp. ATCC 50920]